MDLIDIDIDCYGASARWCGAERLRLALAAPATVAAVFDRLAERYPDFAAQRERVAAAIDDRIAGSGEVLARGAVLALIPPVSGG